MLQGVQREHIETLVPTNRFKMHRVDKALLVASLVAGSVMPFWRSGSFGLDHPELAEVASSSSSRCMTVAAAGSGGLSGGHGRVQVMVQV